MQLGTNTCQKQISKLDYENIKKHKKSKPFCRLVINSGASQSLLHCASLNCV